VGERNSVSGDTFLFEERRDLQTRRSLLKVANDRRAGSSVRNVIQLVATHQRTTLEEMLVVVGAPERSSGYVARHGPDE